MLLESGQFTKFIEHVKKFPLDLENTQLWHLANIHWKSSRFNDAEKLFKKIFDLSNTAMLLGFNFTTPCKCPVHELLLSYLIRINAQRNKPELAEMYYDMIEDYLLVRDLNISNYTFKTEITLHSEVAHFNHRIFSQ